MLAKRYVNLSFARYYEEISNAKKCSIFLNYKARRRHSFWKILRGHAHQI